MSKSSNLPTILWVGDAVASTGFAECTHNVCNYLHSQEWDVRVLGLNYFGDPHSYPYSIYPCRNPFDYGSDGFGVGRLPILIDRIKPDIVVILNDPWNIEEYINKVQSYFSGHEDQIPPIVGWLAVDGKNQKGQSLSGLSRAITWTEFGKNELVNGGYVGDISVIPLGVDSSLFYPRDKHSSRMAILPNHLKGQVDNLFLVGTVGRNQTRKRLDLTIQYFAEWVKRFKVDNARLILHIAPTRDNGFDLLSLTNYFEISGQVLLSSPKPNSLGEGSIKSLMPDIYSSLDVYLSTSQGEGWGLPVLEAMACGVPCIVPDWSGLGDWTQDACIKVLCSSIGINAPINSLKYTVGGVPDKNDTITSIQQVYSDPNIRDYYREKGLALSQSLTWDSTARLMESELLQIIE